MKSKYNIEKYLKSLPNQKINDNDNLNLIKAGRADKVLENFQLFIAKASFKLQHDLKYKMDFEDIYQQLNEIAWKALGKFNIEKSTYITSYITNSINNEVFRIYKKTLKDIYIVTDELIELPIDDDDDDDEKIDVDQKVKECLDILNDEERKLIIYKYINGMRARDIGVSHYQVNKIVQKIRKNISWDIIPKK